MKSSTNIKIGKTNMRDKANPWQQQEEKKMIIIKPDYKRT